MRGRPDGSHGQGVHFAPAGGLSQKVPHLDGFKTGAAGRGVVFTNANRPRIADPGAGVTGLDRAEFGYGAAGKERLSQKMPVGFNFRYKADGTSEISNRAGVLNRMDLGTCADRRAWLVAWFARLADRLRLVRVCCGHWLRVCNSDSVMIRLGTVGLFLDPPYRIKQRDGTHNRSGKLYATDCDKGGTDGLCDEVLAYCKERGGNPAYRIAVCGLTGEGYEDLEALGWECWAWKSSGGYGNRNADNDAKHRERIWFSPHCRKDTADLFAHAEVG